MAIFIEEGNSPEEIRRENFAQRKLPLYEFFFCFLSFLFAFASYCFIKAWNDTTTPSNGAVAKIYGTILLAGILVAFFVLFKKHKLTYRKIWFLLFLVGFVLRLTYVLYSEEHLRQYDTFPGGLEGHYGYALSFYETGKLPTEFITPDSIYQFYHPPLNAFLQGMFMHVFEAVNVFSVLESNSEVLYGSCRILSAFYMTLTSLFFLKTVFLFPLSDRAKTLAVAFLSLYPALILLSGQFNNDSLATCFSVISLYFYFRWFTKGKRLSSLLLSSLFLGLAMFSKLSASTIALGMAFGFLYELVQTMRKKEGTLSLKNLLLQYLLFLLLVAPLGLWWSFYTHYVYGLPFFYVFNNLNPALYTGTRGWVLRHRIGDIDSYDFLNYGLIYTNPAYNILIRYLLPLYLPDFTANGAFCSSFDNYNLLLYALRSSLFGEFTYSSVGLQLLGVFIGFFLYLAYFTFWVRMIYLFVKKRRKIEESDLLMGLLMLGILLMFLYLQISMPYGCSMDFRYIVPILLPFSYFLSKGYDESKTLPTKFTVSRVLSWMLSLWTISLLSLSSAFYLAAI